MKLKLVYGLLMVLMLAVGVEAKSPSKPSRLPQVCDLGYSLSLGLLGRAQLAPAADKYVQMAESDAKALGVTLPKFPALTKDKNKNTVDVMGYLLKETTPVVKSLKNNKEIMIFEVGVKTNLMRLLYVPGDDKSMAKVLSDRCKQIGLPGNACKDLTEAVKKKASKSDISQLLQQLEKDLRAYCSK